MFFQSIISQNNQIDYQEQSEFFWTAALTGNYTTVPTRNKATIFVPTISGTDTYNHHIQAKQYYGDDIHCIFSTHEQDEKGAGSRIRYSKSTDNGLTWSAPIVLLEAQDDSTKDFEVMGGRQSVACGLTEYNNELYAIISVDYLSATGGITNVVRTGIGILAVKINSNSTFGTPVWIDTPKSDFVAPASAGVSYPTYSFDASLRENLKGNMLKNQEFDDMISYYATSEYDPLYVRTEFNGNTLAEPTVGRLPNGQLVKMWKGDDGVSGGGYKIAQTSLNGVTWGSLYITNIPDTNTRTRLLKLRDNTFCIVGCNQGALRDPLYFGISTTGLNFTSDNVYNIDVTTYGAQFTGEGKGRGAQHPSQILQLNNGQLCVCYNWNKEEVYCATFDVPTII